MSSDLKLEGTNNKMKSRKHHHRNQIPEEIIEEILLKMPVKSILRFKKVSKSWFNLIKSNRFIHKHLLREPSEEEEEDSSFVAMCLDVFDTSLPGPVLDVCLYDHQQREEASDSDYSDNNNYKWFTCDDLLSLSVDAFPDPDPDPEFIPSISPKLVGYSNGILCFDYFGRTMLVNPSLKEEKILPNPQMMESERNFTGFGFDKTSMDFKVVTIHGREEKKKIVEVYSVRSNSWRRILDDEIEVPSVFKHCHDEPSISFEGKVYWCVSSKQSFYRRILVFNLDTEMFQLMEFPQDCPRMRSCQKLILIDQDQSLAFVSWPNPPYAKDPYAEDPEVVNIWTLNKVGGGGTTTTTTWTKLCSIQCPPDIRKPISFSRKLSKFFYLTSRVCDNQLIIYELINQSSSLIFQASLIHQYRNNGSFQILGRLDVGGCMPSLISLNAM